MTTTNVREALAERFAQYQRDERGRTTAEVLHWRQQYKQLAANAIAALASQPSPAPQSAEAQAQAALASSGQAASAVPELAPYITDDQVIEWADGFIRKVAFNRPVACQIAIEAAKWVRGQYEPSLNGLADALRAEIEPPTFMGEPLTASPTQPASAPAREGATKCPNCFGAGVIGSPGQPCPLCKLTKLGDEYAALGGPSKEPPGVWCQYVAGMIVAYLGGPVDDKRITPIAGIIERRLHHLSPATPAAPAQPAPEQGEAVATNYVRKGCLWRIRTGDGTPNPREFLYSPGDVKDDDFTESLPVFIRLAPQPAPEKAEAVDQFGRTAEMIRFQNDLDAGDDE